jgi:hypothetical protein
MVSATIVTINYFTWSHNIKITHSYEIFAQIQTTEDSKTVQTGCFQIALAQLSKRSSGIHRY